MRPVLYEVTLRAQREIADDLRAWLPVHIREMLALPGFREARLSEAVPAGDGVVEFCCHYRLRDAVALDDYLRDHAARMREDGLRRFGDRFAASRRVLEIVADF